MASVTYGKCYLWQKYYVKRNYGKNIMAIETEPSDHRWRRIPCFSGWKLSLGYLEVKVYNIQVSRNSISSLNIRNSLSSRIRQRLKGTVLNRTCHSLKLKLVEIWSAVPLNMFYISRTWSAVPLNMFYISRTWSSVPLNMFYISRTWLQNVRRFSQSRLNRSHEKVRGVYYDSLCILWLLVYIWTLCVYWDSLCILGHPVYSGTPCVYYDSLCILGLLVYIWTPCVYWDSLWILGHPVYWNSLCILELPVYIGTPCKYWDSLCILGFPVYTGTPCVY